jgi:hypothetical protein
VFSWRPERDEKRKKMETNKETIEKYINRKKEIDELIINGKVNSTDAIYEEYKTILRFLKKHFSR